MHARVGGRRFIALHQKPLDGHGGFVGELDRAREAVFEAHRHMAQRFVFHGITRLAAKAASALVAHERRCYGIALHLAGCGVKGGVAIVLVPKHLHEEGVALHVYREAPAGFAIQLFADDPGARLGCEIACGPAGGTGCQSECHCGGSDGFFQNRIAGVWHVVSHGLEGSIEGRFFRKWRGAPSHCLKYHARYFAKRYTAWAQRAFSAFSAVLIGVVMAGARGAGKQGYFPQ
ncbi:hypothetical protein D3C72_1410810 [compost metagenome]